MHSPSACDGASRPKTPSLFFNSGQSASLGSMPADKSKIQPLFEDFSCLNPAFNKHHGEKGWTTPLTDGMSPSQTLPTAHAEDLAPILPALPARNPLLTPEILEPHIPSISEIVDRLSPALHTAERVIIEKARKELKTACPTQVLLGVLPVTAPTCRKFSCPPKIPNRTSSSPGARVGVVPPRHSSKVKQ